MNRLDFALVAAILADRERELERRARIRRLMPARIVRDPIRRRVGRQLVRLGASLADDPMLEPARYP